MSAKPFAFPIQVAPEDIDFMGHVNNARYLNWVQDAVLAHWRKLAPADEVATKAWVALKHEITYRRPAFLEDDVIAQTVLEKFHGARAFYSTVIRRGEEVLAEVQSSWCCIDAETLRPARIGEHLRAFFLPDGE
ncbi:acyl-CoA thioesterase [Qipengyuania oceanensis]|uniref:Acyl-CoA thioesterase n=1 Tax=Qipengyuania oceanensis TaxID=1463597 RepID=A0A844YHA2_9SPHN|nr:thioesterase family protein [Qipengyuania oceanensis]MXO63900.1 acyl-CoA thioesterase [Qipengyuania oceanensis]